MPGLKSSVLAGVQWLAWYSGWIRVQHLRRHAQTLTVFGLHRVLGRDDPRRPTAMPEWTVLDTTFRSALSFIARNYHVVQLSAVVRSVQDGDPLPARAALITFDDGWADTADTAAPILSEMGIPAVVFVISGLVGSVRGTWESEWYAALQRADASTVERVRDIYLPGSGIDLRSEGGVDVLCRVLRKQPLSRRFSLVTEHFGGFVETGAPQMVTAADLVKMVGQGIDIGAHTISHDPLVGMTTAPEEITGSIRQLSEIVAPVGASIQSFSFPHGSYTRDIANLAVGAGAAVCFTSDLVLIPTQAGRPHDNLMGRVWVGRTLADASGRLVPQRAAWRYFRTDVQSQPHPVVATSR